MNAPLRTAYDWLTISFTTRLYDGRLCIGCPCYTKDQLAMWSVKHNCGLDYEIPDGGTEENNSLKPQRLERCIKENS